MRFLLVLIFTLFSFATFANSEVTTQIHDIDMGQVNEEPLIFLTTGQVVTYPVADKSMMTRLKDAIKNKTWFVLTLNTEREIINLKEIPSPPSIPGLKMLG